MSASCQLESKWKAQSLEILAQLLYLAVILIFYSWNKIWNQLEKVCCPKMPFWNCRWGLHWSWTRGSSWLQVGPLVGGWGAAICEKLRRRSYAKDDAMQQLAKKIDTLVFKFMLGSQVWLAKCGVCMKYHRNVIQIPMTNGTEEGEKVKGEVLSCNTILWSEHAEYEGMTRTTSCSV